VFLRFLGRTACGGKNFLCRVSCCHVGTGKAVLKWRVFVMVMTFLALVLLNRIEVTRETAFWRLCSRVFM